MRNLSGLVMHLSSRPMSTVKKLTAFFLLLMLVSSAAAQMARKPSPTREPPGVMNKTPDSRKNSLPRIATRAEFDSVARVYHQGTPYALPHTMFVIDRRDNNKI